jgi:hypothetical protein
MANRRNRLIRRGEVTHGPEHPLIEAKVFRRTPPGEDQGIVSFRFQGPWGQTYFQVFFRGDLGRLGVRPRSD